jgi:hypothetical protein
VAAGPNYNSKEALLSSIPHWNQIMSMNLVISWYPKDDESLEQSSEYSVTMMKLLLILLQSLMAKPGSISQHTLLPIDSLDEKAGNGNLVQLSVLYASKDHTNYQMRLRKRVSFKTKPKISVYKPVPRTFDTLIWDHFPGFC